MPATAPVLKPRFYPTYEDCFNPEFAENALREAMRAGKKAGTRLANREKSAEERGKKAKDQLKADEQARNRLNRAMEMNNDHNRDLDQVMDIAVDAPILFDSVTKKYVRSQESCGAAIEPEGKYALSNPPALISDKHMISAHMEREDVDLRIVMDLETAGLNPTFVHVCSAFVQPGDDRRDLTLDDEKDVVLLYSSSEMNNWLFGVWFKHIIDWIENGMGSRRTHVDMHNSSRFDGMCISSFFGLKAGDEGVLFMYRYGDTDYFIRASISKFGDFPKITFLLDLGKKGSFRMEILDSLALLATPLGSFATKCFKKTDTPVMFTKPVEWLASQGYADLSVTEFEQYTKSAHRYELLADGRWVTHWFINKDGIETFSMTPLVSDKHPRGRRYSARTIEAICYWKSYRGEEEMRYAKHDVLMLGNALNTYYRICEAQGIQSVGAYQTSAQIGAQGQIKAITQDMYVLDENGEIIFEEREGFAVPFPKAKYPSYKFQIAISNGRKNWLLSETESLEVMRTGYYTPKGGEVEDGEDGEEGSKAKKIEFRTDGMMNRHGYTAQHLSWHISSFANRFFFMVQRGGRNEVIWAKNPDGTCIVIIDANSMYPSVMRDGVAIRFYEKDYKGIPAYYNAIMGYPDPRLLQSGSTDWMDRAGLVACLPSSTEKSYYGLYVINQLGSIIDEEIRDEFKADLRIIKENFEKAEAELKHARKALNEEVTEENKLRFEAAVKNSKDYDFSPLAKYPNIRVENNGARVIHTECSDRKYVIGRKNVLMMLQARTGAFHVALPRSKCAYFRKIGAVPVSLSGSDHDGRACYPDWEGGRLHVFITGEELQYFLTEETVADHLVEVDLDRSMHGPILGVAVGVTANGIAYTHGKPTSPFADYIKKAWKARRKCKRRIKAIDRAIDYLKGQRVQDILKIEDLEAQKLELKLKSLMIKNYMNAGGYGVQAQNIKPSIEFDSDDLTACLNAVLALSTQDSTWAPVDAFSRRVAASLERLGALDHKRKRIQGSLDELGLGAIRIDDLNFSKGEQVAAVLSKVKALFSDEDIAAAKVGSALQYVVSALESPTRQQTWMDLSKQLSIMNGYLKPKLEVVDEIESVILSNRQKGGEDASETIVHLAKRGAFDAIGKKLFARSEKLVALSARVAAEIKRNGGKKPAKPVITSRQQMWSIIAERLREAKDAIKGHLDIYRMIFAEFAANHFRSFQALHFRMDDGRHVTRYMMSTIEETASHANRAFAVAIPAKARVKLHQAMRALYDIGLEVAYFDTDSLHVIVPCTPDQDPEQVLKQKLKTQSIIKLGDDLGEWDIERKRVEKELAVGKWKKGAVIRASNVYYLGKKVIMFCDDEHNILDCRVAGISLRETKQRAALMAIVKQTARLGDRAGLVAAAPTLMDRLGIYDYGTRERPNAVCGMYANSTRIYTARRSGGEIDRSSLSSTAVVLKMDKAMKPNKAVSRPDGSVIIDTSVSRTKMTAREAGERYSEQGYARNCDRGLESMEEAVKMYLENCKIAGVPVEQVRESIKEEHKKLADQHKAGDIAYELDEDLYGSLSSPDFGDDKSEALVIEQYEEMGDAVIGQLA